MTTRPNESTEDYDDEFLDDDSFVDDEGGDGPPDNICGCEDDRELYDD